MELTHSTNPFRSARVVARRQWTGRLFTLAVDVPNYAFSAGQFASLALPALPEDNLAEPMLARPYSFLNAPDTRPLEFLIATVEGGALTSRLAQLNPGDEIAIGEPFGFLSCENLPQASTLWLFATGTGLAPFLSMLNTPTPWQKFEHIVLLHGVRQREECVYRDVIAALAHDMHPGKLTYRACVTRPDAPDSAVLPGRITHAIASGELERQVQRPLSAETSQVILCGNPAMIEEVQTLLKARGMTRNRVSKPAGQITVEKYW